MFHDIDLGIRKLLHSLPQNLRCPFLPLSAFAYAGSSTNVVDRDHSGRDVEQAIAAIDSTVLSKQQIRLAMHFCMLFCKPSTTLLRSPP